MYGALVKKEISIRHVKLGTFRRVARGKWRHKKFPGWLRFEKSFGNVMTIEVRSILQEKEWQLLSAFIGFVDRNFAGKIRAINIQYEK